jgi:hypothetical protein
MDHAKEIEEVACYRLMDTHMRMHGTFLPMREGSMPGREAAQDIFIM